MLPTQKEIEVPLLEVLREMGGGGRPSDVYPLVAAKFPDIDENDLAETIQSGGNRWANRLQWVRQRLVAKGEIDSPARGVWRVTEKGRQRLARLGLREISPPSLPSEPRLTRVTTERRPASMATERLPFSTATFLELYEGYETSFRAQLLDALQTMSPRQFEQFAQKLLAAYGFTDVQVTSSSRDGGIDGHGQLQLGLAAMNVAFQCKRWQGSVGRPEVDKFRGAIQGQYAQGVFFTTSDFTSAAKDASLRRGAVPVILLNGEHIVNLMIDKGLGVERVSLYRYRLRPDDLESDDE